MRLLTVRVPRDFNLYQFGDTHEGSILKYNKGIEKFIETVRQDKAGYAIHVGDEIEGIIIDDKRYDLDTTKQPIPFKQAKAVIEQFRPLGSKLITILWGNHPYKLWKFGNLTEHICHELNIPFGDYSCKISFRDGRNKPMFKAYVEHGNKTFQNRAGGPHQREGNRQEALKRWLSPLAGDCAYMGQGHAHEGVICEPFHQLWMSDDAQELKQKYWKPEYKDGEFIHPDHRVYVCSPAFKKSRGVGITSWEERRGFAPSELGYVKTRIENGQIVQVEKVVL